MPVSASERLASAVDAFVRHHPERFVDGDKWFESSPPAVDLVRAARGKKRSKRLRARTLAEGAIVSMRATLRASLPEELSIPNAEKTVLLAWLLSSDTGVCTFTRAICPDGLAHLPYLGQDDTLYLSLKYRLSSDPRWKDRLRAALRLVGGKDYLPATKMPPEKPTASSIELQKLNHGDELDAVPRPCDRLALQAYRWAEGMRPSMKASAGRRVSPQLWDFMKAHGCHFYEGRSIPHKNTWLRYVRRALCEIDGPRYNRRAGRELGRSIVQPDQIE